MNAPRLAESLAKYAKEHRDLLFIVLIVLTGLFFIAKWYTPLLNRSTDGDAYLLLARSIAEGKGYRDIHVPGEPEVGLR